MAVGVREGKEQRLPEASEKTATRGKADARSWR